MFQAYFRLIYYGGKYWTFSTKTIVISLLQTLFLSKVFCLCNFILT